MTQNIVIDGLTIDSKLLHDFSVRWYLGNGGSLPVLYSRGKRVTKAWKIVLDVEQEPDPYGGNANTD